MVPASITAREVLGCPPPISRVQLGVHAAASLYDARSREAHKRLKNLLGRNKREM
jgi:hypothetical protein